MKLDTIRKKNNNNKNKKNKNKNKKKKNKNKENKKIIIIYQPPVHKLLKTDTIRKKKKKMMMTMMMRVKKNEYINSRQTRALLAAAPIFSREPFDVICEPRAPFLAAAAAAALYTPSTDAINRI